MKKLQILVATMFQTDFSLLDKMNITSDVVFANQSDSNEITQHQSEDYKAQMITTDTRGVGLNRNIALEHAEGDILLIADDDVRYVTDYEWMILDAFSELPDADAIIFNIDTDGQDMKRRKNDKIRKIYIWNALNYGAVRIAVKREKLVEHRIKFNLNFGGGTIYSSGEDTLFIVDMLRHGFRIYTYPTTIASVQQLKSTWFTGYNRKYFYDKGALFAALSPKLALVLCLQDIVRHRKMYSELTVHEMINQCRRGIKGYAALRPYTE